MSLSPSAQRAVEWLEQQVTDLTGIRNATPRDPSFKNWRQSCLTTLQRVWPGDQERSERFRRIPFSPVDPRADARIIREWYSRGCQEAARVLNGFVEDVRQNGVPEQPAEVVVNAVGADFEDDFPTVDLPAGDLMSASNEPVVASNMLSEFVDDAPQASAANAPAPPSLPSEIPAIHNPVAEVHAHDTRQTRKGVGARLKDLLGFAQLSAKALAGFQREQTPPSGLPSLDAPVSASRPSMDVVPLGGAVQNERRRAQQPPTPPPSAPAADKRVPHAPKASEPVPKAPPALSISLPQNQPPPAGAPTSGSWPLPKPVERDKTEAVAPPAATPPAASATPAPRVHEAGMSVVMSRPTTLRAAIEKVSIESLLSDQFRAPASDTSPPAATPPAVVPPTSVTPPPVPPAAQETTTAELEGMVNAMLASSAGAVPAPPPEPAARTPIEPPTVAPASREPATVEPAKPDPVAGMASPGALAAAGDVAPDSQGLGLPEIEAIEGEPDPPPASPTPPSTSPSRFLQLPPRRRSPRGQESEAEEDSAVGRVDPDAFARATEDFMRSSPVLGATGRKVKRPEEETGFGDPDAIAVASMVQELGRLDVPVGRQAEVRARLLDLARRIEKGELEWMSLRKAVWFAMEYPEIARRLMPVLLPWIDRAA